MRYRYKLLENTSQNLSSRLIPTHTVSLNTSECHWSLRWTSARGTTICSRRTCACRVSSSHKNCCWGEEAATGILKILSPGRHRNLHEVASVLVACAHRSTHSCANFSESTRQRTVRKETNTVHLRPKENQELSDKSELQVILAVSSTKADLYKSQTLLIMLEIL